jgi:hypothetical protein
MELTHMAAGDHIKTRRTGFWHHGIDCGDGTVIHFARGENRCNRASVSRTPLEYFACGARVQRVRHLLPDDPLVVLARAFSRLGDTEYHVLFNNCEHFARWCATGRRESRQVRGAAGVAAGLALATGLAGVVLVGGGVAVSARLGARYR